MKKSKLLLFACCTALAVSSAPVYGARIPKPSVSSDKPAASVFKNTATQALDLIDLAQEERVERIGEMCRLDYAQSGVLASVTAAQCILESGYLTSELASEANNCFGMKSLHMGRRLDLQETDPRRIQRAGRHHRGGLPPV